MGRKSRIYFYIACICIKKHWRNVRKNNKSGDSGDGGGDRMFGDVDGIETFYSVLTFEACKSPLFNNKVLKNFLMCF